MGYFSSGSEGLDYAALYCDKCINYQGCWIWGEHLLNNYAECNSKDSYLHKLIPIDEHGNNGKCVMFNESLQDMAHADKEESADDKRHRQYEREYMEKRNK